MPNFAQATVISDYVFGVMHSFIVLACIFFMIGSKVRGHRLSCYQWFFFANLAIEEFMVCIVMFQYFGLGHSDAHNCKYWDHIFLGLGDIQLFGLTMLLGYKMYTAARNMYEFAVKGNLPSRSAKSRDKTFYTIIVFFSISDIVVYVLLNTYWTFVDR